MSFSRVFSRCLCGKRYWYCRGSVSATAPFCKCQIFFSQYVVVVVLLPRTLPLPPPPFFYMQTIRSLQRVVALAIAIGQCHHFFVCFFTSFSRVAVTEFSDMGLDHWLYVVKTCSEVGNLLKPPSLQPRRVDIVCMSTVLWAPQSEPQ